MILPGLQSIVSRLPSLGQWAMGWMVLATALSAGAQSLGEEIVNQAGAQYIRGTGQPEALQSSPVQVHVTAPPGVSLLKRVSTSAPVPNQVVAFTLKTANAAGGAPATGVPCVVDGQARVLIIVLDVLPDGLRLVALDTSGLATPLYHRAGDAAHLYATAPPPDLAQVDAVGFGVPGLAAGETVSRTFTAQVLATAGTMVQNIARVYSSAGGGRVTESLSNPVQLVPSESAALLEFCTDASYTQTATVLGLNQPLFVQARASGCNRDPLRIETIIITIVSALTGDRENFTVVETAANSGVFRLLNPAPTRNVISVIGNGILEVRRNEVLTASLDGCGGTSTTSATLLIDPAGVVFDSRTGALIPGARVTLIDANSSLPAQVFAADGRTPSPSTLVTGADGRFDFPLVAPGLYRLVVLPPPGYTGPSRVQAAQLPPGRLIQAGSYGVNFPVNVQTGRVLLDVPLDPVADASGASLFLQKTASRASAEIGDYIDYTVRVKNVSGVALNEILVGDQLPAGFAFQRGSARFEGRLQPDPAAGAGPNLGFPVGPVPVDATVTLTYRVRVGPGALQGTGENTAQAVTVGQPRFFSNVGRVRVQLQPGVFTDKGVVVGKVFLDANRNRDQDGGEPGIPGVRIYLEDGTYAVTDSEGKYSIYGLRPMTHVLKVDDTTLPPGAKLVPLSTRNAMSGGSRFVDLKKGELHKADFAVSNATPAVVTEIKKRRAEADRTPAAEVSAGAKSELTRDGVPLQRGDPKSLPASGVIGPRNGATPPVRATAPAAAPRAAAPAAAKPVPAPKPAPPQDWTTIGFTPEELAARTNLPPNAYDFTPVLPPGTLTSENSNLPGSPLASPPPLKLETLLSNLDNTLGFIGLKEGDTLPMAQATVRVKGRQGARFSVSVNGDAVPASRLGKRAVLAAKQLEAWEFIGVAFRPGTNTLTLTARDPGGNVRGTAVLHVRAPDKLGQIKIVLPGAAQVADGKSPATITVLLQDARGVPVTARTPLTLDASLGEWLVADLNKTEPGTQVFIEGGRAEYAIRAPLEPGDSKVRVTSGALQGQATLSFLPELRPLLAVGLVEGQVNLSRLGRGVLVPARSRDGFDEELRAFAASGRDGKLHGAGRAAFFLKGRIKGEYLLTAAYDSEKTTRERLFRDIQPDEFYPVYGDSAVKGFDAQSTGRLYVRVDNKKCYLLYGDFITQGAGEARQLGNYSRSLTGVKEHYEKNALTANIWASQDSTRQVIEERRGNGTSGPYFFSTPDGLVNSEKIEILTRDRHQPELILKTVPLSRFSDYEFEPFTGRILFKAPVPSLDENLNPISIRVTFETDQGGAKFWTYGADGQVVLSPGVEFGGSAVRDENPRGSYDLQSANATFKVAPKTFLVGELARSDSAGVSGEAGRVELRHQGDKLDARVFYGRTGETFTNAAAILGSGRIEGGAKVSYKAAPGTRLIGQAIDTASLGPQAGSRKGVRADVEKTFKNQVRIETGVRHSTETANPASSTTAGATPNKVTSARVKVSVPVPKLKNARVYGELENDAVDPDKRLVAVGGEYQLGTRTRLYARHEFLNALGGPFELNGSQQQHTTVVGLDTEYMKGGQSFNEYRMRDAISGREAEAATGLRNQWTLAEGLRASTSFERVTPLSGGLSTKATAIAGGLEYTRNPDWKASTRLELRASEPNDSLLHTFAYARRIDQDWTFLGRTIVYLVDNQNPGVGDKQQARFQAGLAWRQTEASVWNALGKYEYKIENDDTQPGQSLRRQVHILSLDANYQPHRDWQLSGHYAGKLSFDKSNGARDAYHAHLLASRAVYELTERWDAGLVGSALFSGGFRSVQYGFGPEVGFTLRRSARIAIGYNFFGFQDRDLSAENYTQRGVYLALRLKFDESLVGLGKAATP